MCSTPRALGEPTVPTRGRVGPPRRNSGAWPPTRRRSAPSRARKPSFSGHGRDEPDRRHLPLASVRRRIDRRSAGFRLAAAPPGRTPRAGASLVLHGCRIARRSSRAPCGTADRPMPVGVSTGRLCASRRMPIARPTAEGSRPALSPFLETLPPRRTRARPGRRGKPPRYASPGASVRRSSLPAPARAGSSPGPELRHPGGAARPPANGGLRGAAHPFRPNERGGGRRFACGAEAHRAVADGDQLPIRGVGHRLPDGRRPRLGRDRTRPPRPLDRGSEGSSRAGARSCPPAPIRRR